MQPAKTLALALAALALSGGSAALASTIQLSDDRRGDARCESKPCPDLKSAIANPGIFNKNELNTSAPEFYVEKRATGAGVFNVKTGRKSGPATWRNYNAKSANWTFLPSAIGNPSSYGWRVEVVQAGSKVDATPNAGYLKRSLR